MKSNFMEVHNILNTPSGRKANRRKLQRKSDNDSRFVVSKQRPTRVHRWYAGDAEFGGTSKAAPWALKNNMPGYEPKTGFIKHGDLSLDKWLESKGINRPENNPQEGIDIAEFRDHMSQPAKRLWYK